jgi:central kinetochore subunit Mal2/MCM21
VAPTAQLDHVVNASNIIKEQSLAVLASNTRTISGITAMRLQDPDPNAVNAGKVLGVRIDVFSTAKKHFLAPYHLFFHEVGDTGILRLHKHTIPTFVPLQHLLRRHMPTPDPESEDGGDGAARQDLPLFLRALRQELVCYAKRLDAIEKLKLICVGKGRQAHKITVVTMCDPGAREVELEWQDGAVARLRMGLDGLVERTVVRSKGGARSGRRKRRLERMIMSEGGHVSDLPLRLRKAATE